MFAGNLDKLVAKAMADEENPFLTASEKSVAEELEICREQIESLQQLLKIQTLILEDYSSEIDDCHHQMQLLNQELKTCHEEIAKLKGSDITI